MAYSWPIDFEVFETNYLEKFFKKRIFLTAKGYHNFNKKVHSFSFSITNNLCKSTLPSGKTRNYPSKTPVLTWHYLVFLEEQVKVLPQGSLFPTSHFHNLCQVYFLLFLHSYLYTSRGEMNWPLPDGGYSAKFQWVFLRLSTNTSSPQHHTDCVT